jgi:hypothetical protein
MVLEKTMRSAMRVRQASAVNEKPGAGRNTRPRLALREVSSFSGAMPSARVTGLPSRAVRVSVSTPAPFRLVETEL